MSRLSVLLADDNEPIRELMAAALRRHFSVHRPVADGKQLVQAALERDPDVIVTDVWMPRLGGIEALHVLRRLGRKTPFVMVSADANIGPDCLAAGASAFVCKVDIERELVPAVLAAFAGKENSAPRSAPAVEGDSRLAPPATAVPAGMPPTPKPTRTTS
jgi:CheY-like chemotaxis protein